jgi:hypothetical protein
MTLILILILAAAIGYFLYKKSKKADYKADQPVGSVGTEGSPIYDPTSTEPTVQEPGPKGENLK